MHKTTRYENQRIVIESDCLVVVEVVLGHHTPLWMILGLMMMQNLMRVQNGFSII